MKTLIVWHMDSRSSYLTPPSRNERMNGPWQSHEQVFIIVELVYF